MLPPRRGLGCRPQREAARRVGLGQHELEGGFWVCASTLPNLPQPLAYTSLAKGGTEGMSHPKEAGTAGSGAGRWVVCVQEVPLRAYPVISVKAAQGRSSANKHLAVRGDVVTAVLASGVTEGHGLAITQPMQRFPRNARLSGMALCLLPPCVLSQGGQPTVFGSEH